MSATADGAPIEGGKELSTKFKKANADHMREINTKCKDNLELQLLVLRTIRNYEGNVSGGTGSTLGEALKSRRDLSKQVKKEALAEEERGDFEHMFKKVGPLQRGRYLYKTWGIGMYRELFRYCFQWFTKELANKLTDPERYREMMEFQWDIRCTASSKEADKIASTDKRTLFERLRGEVEQKGDMLQPFAESLELGYIDWAKEGHYSFRVEGAGDELKVTIEAKRMKRTTAVPNDIVQSDDGWASATLLCNHSMHSAYLKTATSTYQLKALFPHMCKLLKRHNSDSSKITASTKSKVAMPADKHQKGPSDTGGSASGVDELAVGAMMAQPVLPPSPVAGDDVKAEEDGEERKYVA